ncbi:MAG: aminoacyl-tRNA hydrolase [Lachnospiraceae bacterium]|nr:aminoacyl-tRNA hydrolase [Lachnospiraceae bacterium]
MVIIAGLGNPGRKYENTRHNAGFMALDALAESVGIRVNSRRFRALTGKGVIAGVPVLLMKPQTYMNLSGESIRAACDFFHVEPQDLIVFCDDVNFDPGILRIRKSGSAGGHNGLKNIIQQLGSQEFQRIRIGVGKQPEQMDLIDFVLSRFSEEEMKALREAANDAAEAAVVMLRDGTDAAMNRFNGRKETKPE